MKTAGRENPNHGVTLPRNRAHGAAGQNRSRSIKWAEKQEKFPAEGDVFFLDFYLYRTYRACGCKPVGVRIKELGRHVA
jgi:hypothetical protein